MNFSYIGIVHSTFCNYAVFYYWAYTEMSEMVSSQRGKEKSIQNVVNSEHFE